MLKRPLNLLPEGNSSYSVCRTRGVIHDLIGLFKNRLHGNVLLDTYYFPHCMDQSKLLRLPDKKSYISDNVRNATTVVICYRDYQHVGSRLGSCR